MTSHTALYKSFARAYNDAASGAATGNPEDVIHDARETLGSDYNHKRFCNELGRVVPEPPDPLFDEDTIAALTADLPTEEELDAMDDNAAEYEPYEPYDWEDPYAGYTEDQRHHADMQDAHPDYREF